ncbi:dihydroxyacetone kinase transcriptional activator DhaS [Lacticaseibacillus songhuajiangensis]|uniref:dihydroxyacetone kinase transcriptional activator DhaS n=1 Tax=Lacticaseibacillus songhuajiangensis TaxID=1296539 RepID=UPI001CDCE5C2|nr:dihydroxyacetone kinase transcriptional activator DhaS [Lacticaseibacillus songhuajiangensis]
MAYITRKKIAAAFMTTVISRGFDHTSVKAIMDATDLGRQTFYLHFQDKYELLEWAVDDRMQEVIETNFDYLQWGEIIRLVCFEIEAQQAFYRSVCTVQYEVDITAVIAAHLQLLIRRQLVQRSGSEGHAHELVQMVAHGIAAQLISNVSTLHPVDYEILAARATAAIGQLLHGVPTMK